MNINSNQGNKIPKQWPKLNEQPKLIMEFHNRLQQLLKKHS